MKENKITCTNDITMYLDYVEVEGKNLLKLDFNIKSYKALKFGQGWETFSLPENVFVEDKLFLDEAIIDILIHHLQSFIDTGTLNLNSMTQRGFQYRDFKDVNGKTISLQESSSMDVKIWFGLSTKDKVWKKNRNDCEPFDLKGTDRDNRSILIDDRLHLDEKLTSELLDEFKKFKVYNQYKELQASTQINKDKNNKKIKFK